MPQNPQDALNDPKFQALSPDAQRIVMGKLDPRFGALSPDAQGIALQKMIEQSQKDRGLNAIVGHEFTMPSTVTISPPPKPFTMAWVKHGYYNAVNTATELLPAVGATAGGIIGFGAGGPVSSVGGAGIGGMGGEAARQLLRRKLLPGFNSSLPQTSVEAGNKIMKEGVIGAGSQAMGEGLGVAGRALTRPGPVIAGVEMPQTLAQTVGHEQGVLGQGEHYLKGTFLGKPLQKVEAQQQVAVKQALANLAGSPEAPERIAQNWAVARQATRAQATPIYESLANVPVPRAVPAAQTILQDEQAVRLMGTSAKNAISKFAESEAGGANEIAKGLGYKSALDAESKMGKEAWNSYMTRVGSEAGVSTSGAPSFGLAQQARSELADALQSTRDLGDRRILATHLKNLDNAINASLTPEQVTQRAAADRLWNRSYIQDDLYNSFKRMLVGQGDQPSVKTTPLNKIVAKLNEPAGGIPGARTQMDVLFDNPADKKALTDLAAFLQKTQGGKGVGRIEGLARIGLVLGTLKIPYDVATGNMKSAERESIFLGTLAALSQVLARNQGPRLVMQMLANREGSPGFAAASARLADFYANMQNDNASPAQRAGLPEWQAAQPKNYTNATDVMLDMKNGTLSSQEGNRILQRMKGKGSIVRPMAPPQ